MNPADCLPHLRKVNCVNAKQGNLASTLSCHQPDCPHFVSDDPDWSRWIFAGTFLVLLQCIILVKWGWRLHLCVLKLEVFVWPNNFQGGSLVVGQSQSLCSKGSLSFLISCYDECRMIWTLDPHKPICICRAVDRTLQQLHRSTCGLMFLQSLWRCHRGWNISRKDIAMSQGEKSIGDVATSICIDPFPQNAEPQLEQRLLQHTIPILGSHFVCVDGDAPCVQVVCSCRNW